MHGHSFSTQNKSMLSNSSKTLITYLVFAIAFAIVTTTFVTTTTYTQLAIAVVLYLLLAVTVGYKLIPNEIWRQSPPEKPITHYPPPAKVAVLDTEQVAGKSISLGIADIDKRVFLSIIGGGGLVLFLLSLFNKNTESLLFKSPTSSSSNSVNTPLDPASNQILEGYRISEIDDNVISFYGFIKKDGNWYIMRIDTNTGSFRYVKGESSFPSNWTNREDLHYDYFSNVF